jgi:hypothetical protein
VFPRPERFGELADDRVAALFGRPALDRESDLVHHSAVGRGVVCPRQDPRRIFKIVAVERLYPLYDSLEQSAGSNLAAENRLATDLRG